MEGNNSVVIIETTRSGEEEKPMKKPALFIFAPELSLIPQEDEEKRVSLWLKKNQSYFPKGGPLQCPQQGNDTKTDGDDQKRHNKSLLETQTHSKCHRHHHHQHRKQTGAEEEEDKRRFYSKNSTHLFLLLPNNQYQNNKRKSRQRILSYNRLQHLLIGLCVGITLGIVFVPILDHHCYSQFKELDNISMKSAEEIGSGHVRNESSHYKTDSPVKKSNKFIRRPRFFSTELGLRKKIVCGVILTDLSRVENVLAINQTLGPHVNQMVYFAVGVNWANTLKNAGLAGVVTLSDKSPLKNMSAAGEFTHLSRPEYHRAVLKVMRFLGSKLSDNFDYFFIGIDVFYIHGNNLIKAIKSMSISQNVLWGSVESPEKPSSCSVESGFIIGRTLLKKLSSRIDRCLISPSLNFGSNIPVCFKYAVGDEAVMCSNNIQGQSYLVASVGNTSALQKVVAIGPLSSAREMYKIHIDVSKTRLFEIEQETQSLIQQKDEVAPYIPSEFNAQTWPKGYPPPHIPSSRYDVLKWKFFTSKTIYPMDELSSEAKVDGIEELDLSSVVNSSIRYLQRFQQMNANDTWRNAFHANSMKGNVSTLHEFYFEYGYKRFDETRGMEYILQFKDVLGNIQSVQCLRPLTKIEVVPMPFVTENRRLSIVVPVTLEQYQETEAFLKNFFDVSTHKKNNCVLILAIIVRDSLLDLQTMSKLHKLKQLVLETNYNHHKKETVSPTNATIVIASSDILKVAYVIVNMKQARVSNYALAIADTLFSRILQNPNNLVLLTEKFVSFKDDFLNRVRMSTILNYQIYSPIPFVEYDPRLSHIRTKEQEEIEIRKDTGYWADKTYDFISFCIGDYALARKKLDSAELRKILTFPNKGVSALTSVFLKSSPVHILRSPEPSLKIPFDKTIYSDCSSSLNCFDYKWASKSQLAKFILKHEAEI